MYRAVSRTECRTTKERTVSLQVRVAVIEKDNERQHVEIEDQALSFTPEVLSKEKPAMERKHR